MAIERRRHGHPAVRAGLVVVAAVLVVMLLMTALSILVGLLWAVVKLALLAALVAGVVHVWSSRKGATRR